MPRVKVGLALPDARTLDVEIAHLRDLDIGGLQVRWQNVFRRRPPPHLPRHLLFRILAYRLQADGLGDLDAESQRLLDAKALLKTPANAQSRSNGRPRRYDRARCWLANGTAVCRGSPYSPMALPGTARPIGACRKSPRPLLAPVGTDPSSLACMTSHLKTPKVDE